MLSTENRNTSKGRCLALFPGAFRPPHKAHFFAVLDLASRPDVDEVVVIIANRCRNIPGTTKALDTEVAKRIWVIYLKDVPKARVEVAPKGAVKHALGYFEKVETGDRLLFCIGETDLRRGDERFANLNDLSKRKGIAASLIETPTGAITVRATSLRATLARGDEGREEFMAALPSHLTAEQRMSVWKECRAGMREMGDIIKEKVRALIDRNRFGEVADLSIARDGKTDPVYRVQFKDGRCYFVKYAGDTVASASMVATQSLKPRKRISVERRVIRCLSQNISDNIEIPEVVFFDKETKALVLTEVCPGGRTLEDDLKGGIFDLEVVKEASRFLADCHKRVDCVKPLWGSKANDLSHWRTILSLRTTGFPSEIITKRMRENLKALQLTSDQSRENRLLNLNFCPKNIFVGERKIGVIDLELSSSVGDPACDMGYFFGHYLFWGILTSSGMACQKAIHGALTAYRRRIGDFSLGIQSRTVAFAGASILYNITGNEGLDLHGFKSQLISVAASLLEKGSGPIEDIDQTLSDAVIHPVCSLKEE
jgi:hypothetical protein